MNYDKYYTQGLTSTKQRRLASILTRHCQWFKYNIYENQVFHQDHIVCNYDHQTFPSFHIKHSPIVSFICICSLGIKNIFIRLSIRLYTFALVLSKMLHPNHTQVTQQPLLSLAHLFSYWANIYTDKADFWDKFDDGQWKSLMLIYMWLKTVPLRYNWYS